MDETELFATYRASGDLALRNQIVERYLPIAAMIAKKFVGRGVEFDDLYQIASLALIKGVDRFDGSKGVKFSTFITPTIAGEIKNYFRDRSRLVHLPRRVSELRQSVRKTADEIFSQTGRNPSPCEIATALGVTEEEVVTAMESGGVVSLDRPADGENEDGASYYELIASPEDEFEHLERKDAIRSALKDLTDEERQIVACRFGKELSQSETARRLNVTQMHVSRMERKILEKLKENLRKSAVD